MICSVCPDFDSDDFWDESCLSRQEIRDLAEFARARRRRSERSKERKEKKEKKPKLPKTILQTNIGKTNMAETPRDNKQREDRSVGSFGRMGDGSTTRVLETM